MAEETTPVEPVVEPTVESILEETAQQVVDEAGKDPVEGDAGETPKEPPTGETPPEGTPPEGAVTPKEEPKGPFDKREFQMARDDKVLETLDKSTLDDVLSGALKFTFRAAKEDHSATVDELVDMAQRTLGVEAKRDRYLKERDDTHKKFLSLSADVDENENYRDLLVRALSDDDYLSKLKENFKAAGGHVTPSEEGTPPAAAPATPAAPVMNPRVARGAQMVQDAIMPHAEALAAAFDADAQEIAQEVIKLAGESPQEFFSWEDLSTIINETIPDVLQEAGYTLKEGHEPVTLDMAALERKYSGDVHSGGNMGIRTKASKAPVDSALVAENTRLKAQLEAAGVTAQEKVLEGAPGGSGSTDHVAVDGGEGSSEELDLEGADTLDDIMKRVEAY